MNRQPLIVNLSGEQKRVLGFASWGQVSISAAGIILGVVLFSIFKALFSFAGAGMGTSTIIGGIAFLAAVLPFVYVAFKPIRDNQGNLLYYESKQLMINYRFRRYEIGTYLNVKTNAHAVNSRLPYVYARVIHEHLEEEQ